MNNITAAAQLAVFAFILIGGLLMIEIFARSRASFRHGGSGRHGVPVIRLSGRKAVLCILLCIVPIIIGFAGPFSILLSFVIDDVMRGFQMAQAANIGRLAANSLLLAAVVAGLILVLSVIIGLIATYQSGRFGRILSAASATGYAFPGTILALGVLGFTGYCDGLFQTAFSTTLFAGGFLVLMLGLIVRFQAVGFGAVMSGLERMPPHMMESGRILGHGFSKSVRSVIFPLLRSSVLVGGLLVFVDILKELPMTLILRPFSFETFSTFTYQYAKEEMLEQAAMPALFIVLAGLVPVMIANSALRAGTSNV
jgi:iron(III) transport system permease protein